MFIRSVLVLWLLYIVLPASVVATSPMIEVTEIHAAPAEGYEWIEILWSGNDPVSRDRIRIEDKTGKILNLQSSELIPDAYGIATSEGVLNNSGDDVIIMLDDEVIYEKSYPGHNRGETLVRCNDVWKVASDATPGFAHSKMCESVSDNPDLKITPTSQLPSPTSRVPTPTTQPTPTTTDVSPGTTESSSSHFVSTLIVSEIYTAPEPGGDEWVELYNSGNIQISLDALLLDDSQNSGSSPQKLSGVLEPHNYKVIKLTKSVYNNSGDAFNLSTIEGEVITTFQIPELTSTHSFGLPETTQDTSYCIMKPSPGERNASCNSTGQYGVLNSDNQESFSDTPPLSVLNTHDLPENTGNSQDQSLVSIAPFKQENKPALELYQSVHSTLTHRYRQESELTPDNLAYLSKKLRFSLEQLQYQETRSSVGDMILLISLICIQIGGMVYYFYRKTHSSKEKESSYYDFRPLVVD